MKNKNIRLGIFTITDAINYGAFYQMYALVKYFEGQGADVTVYRGSISLKRILMKYFSFNIFRQFRKLKILHAFYQSRKSLNIKRYRGENLDLAILGSDEIWNLENLSFRHSPFYYGIGISAKKIIAYAPSIGFAKPETLYNSQDFCDGLKRVDTILARDFITKIVAEKITGKNVNIVCDPTILFNNWNNVELPDSMIDSEYILYYGYTSQPPFLSSLLEFSKEEKLPIISAGYHYHPWCSKNLTVGPFGFLRLLKDAKYVFTTTFHGTVMSALLNKRFCYYASGQKVKDFAEKFNLGFLHIDEKSSFKDINRILNSGPVNLNSFINDYMLESRKILEDSIDG